MSFVEEAQRVFPGSRVVSERTYEQFRADMFASIKASGLADEERWELAFQSLASCVYEPDPLGVWCRQLWDEVSTSYEAWRLARKR